MVVASSIIPASVPTSVIATGIDNADIRIQNGNRKIAQRISILKLKSVIFNTTNTANIIATNILSGIYILL